jgi:hydroxymethylglutaryl-CoA synthase
MSGILAYGVYLPFHRLDRRSITAALGAGGGKGTRTVAGYDEDTTSMAVEAGRRAMAALSADAPRPSALFFATADPAYLDKANAPAIHAALGLDPSVPAYDFGGSVRSGTGALRAAMDRAEPTLVISSDIRTGLPGGADETGGGDGAVAFVTAGAGPLLAELVAAAGATEEVLDRWRLPGDRATRWWEERFGEHALGPPAALATSEALKQAGVEPSGLDHVAVSGTSPRAARKVAAGLAAGEGVLVDDLSGTVGFTGAAHAGLLLAASLDVAAPGAVIASVSLADGADVLLFRATDALSAGRPRRSVADQVAAGDPSLPYATFLTWRGLLSREPPRRPDPDAPAGPPARRAGAWKYGFTASRCQACGTRHLPPQRVCLSCRAVDQMEPERLADTPGTIATFTVDRLAFSLNPPAVAAVVDFDGGGRFQCELTDVDPASVAIGQRVEMTFRRLFTANGIHNYFWKARPLT